MTLFSLLILVFLGGLVRVTGSGMGCPDWPKCFGLLVPPTDVSQLPADYKEQFAKPGKPVADFNVFHTWTEYINRLFGALTGLFMLLMFLSSWQFLKTRLSVFVFSSAAFMLVLFQAWIGAKVVDTHLAVGMVTVHLLLAFVVLALVVVAAYLSGDFKILNTGSGFSLRIFATSFLIFCSLQIFLGARTRELIEVNGVSDIIPQSKLIDPFYFIHKVVAALMAVSLPVFWYRSRGMGLMNKLILVLMISTVLQIAMGSINAVFNLPAFSQVLHITLSPIIFGTAVFIFLVSNFNTKGIDVAASAKMAKPAMSHH